MDRTREDDFVVFMRSDPCDPSSPESIEWPLATCASYEEARRLRDSVSGRNGDCVIRFLGETGGGD
ncbi:MAG TPA: hypothetical protein VFW33_02865 [Gemmataceae bacterium]|nr:hypothetical protein [Gemmataceae bacterium]